MRLDPNIIEFVNLGCSKNLVDSERLSALLMSAGYKCRHDSESIEGDTVVINTCGFIGDAKEESIETILKFCELKKKKKISRVFVMGCLSQRYFKELGNEIPEVDKFYGKFDWKNLVKDLGKSYDTKALTERTITTPGHYAYIKISEGCNRRCAYCAIPIITGKHISRPMEEILAEVKWLVSQGVKEFQIIAQDLSYYGKDLYGELKLAELIEKMSEINGVKWIRLHYAYPTDFPWDVLRVMREKENVCKYLDVALQHISDNVLKMMRRHITANETREFIEKVRKEVPGICLRTTLIVGHPGETDESYEELCDFVKEMRFERMGAFMYSEEEGTYSATHYEDNIPLEVKQERLDRIMKIQQRISFQHNSSLIGEVLTVVVDRTEGEYYVCRSQYDSPEVDPEILLPISEEKEIGKFYKVKITNAEEFDLFGEWIQ